MRKKLHEDLQNGRKTLPVPAHWCAFVDFFGKVATYRKLTVVEDQFLGSRGHNYLSKEGDLRK